MSAATPRGADATAFLVGGGAERPLHRDELAADVLGLRRLVPPGGAVTVRAAHAPVVVAALCSLEGWASRVELRGADVPGTPDGPALADVTSFTSAATSTTGPAAAPPARRTTTWTLLTSGTSGEPRLMGHTLASLSRGVRADRDPAAAPRRWGLLYPATRMAGLQVLLQALHGGEQVRDATHLDGVARRVAWLAAHGVDALSATPTVWRQVLQADTARSLALRQITLGGEPVGQRLLDALRRAYPEARITHVYATTETGSVLAISDGRAGFPARLLAAEHGDLVLRDGILHVRAPWSVVADEGGYVRTGDVVEVVGDRAHVRGRDSGVVNVGGQKVVPERAEEELRRHPDVRDARVTPRRNAFSGAILVAEVTVGADADRATLPGSLRALVAERLGAAYAPATVSIVSALTTTPTGKVARS